MIKAQLETAPGLAGSDVLPGHWFSEVVLERARVCEGEALNHTGNAGRAVLWADLGLDAR